MEGNLKIRNIALIGHAGEGKTTLAEAILFNAKAIDRQGKIEDGNTVCDFDPEEIARKGSISLANAYCEYKGYKFNIIDVPGFFDFEGEMIEALSVVDTAIIVTGASGVMTVGTELALEYCLKNRIPTMIFISGLDKENCDYMATVEAIKAKYPQNVAPFVLPVLKDGRFDGFIAVALCKTYDNDGNLLGDIPADMKDKHHECLTALSELAAISKDEYMEEFFEKGVLSYEQIIEGVKLGIKEGTAIPIMGGSGLQNKGIYNLMDKIIDLGIAPNDGQKDVVIKGEDEVEVDCDVNGKTLIRVYKTIVDPFVGKLNLFKVIRGKIKVGDTLKNVNKDVDEKITSLYFVKGKKQEAVTEICAGDFGALAKSQSVQTGDTLSEDVEIKFPPIDVPKAVYSMAVSASKKGEEDKVFGGLNKLKDEDISFTVTKNVETNQMLLSGLGDTQLALICKKLKNKFGVEAVLTEPRVAFRETIKKKAEAEGKHKKQSGGAGQFGDCWVRFEPGASDGVYEFVDEVVGGAVPKQFIPAVDKGLREASVEGVLAGYPMVNLKCTLFDGKYHPVDSKEIAFVTAAHLAYQEGIKNASPCILEPIDKLEIVVPDNFMGDIMGDINKRRGRILGTDQKEDKAIVLAEVPEAELKKYAIDLRSMTQGRGRFTAEFVRYEEVPPTSQDAIIAEAKKLKEQG